MNKFSNENIRIGTLVKATDPKKTADYIKQILPYGFESFALVFWQTLGNIDVAELADAVNNALDSSDTVISAIGVYGNPMEQEELDVATLRGWEKLIDNAHLFKCDIVTGFTGRLRGKPIHECIDRFKEVFKPLVQRAGAKDVKLAFENCDMGGTWASGDWNIAHNPAAWELMFDAVDAPNIGLEWEPCHQMVSLIDPMPQLREWVGKMFHIHGKDATIYWDIVRKFGVHAGTHDDIAIKGKKNIVPPFAYHRTPGFGDSNWTDIISELRKYGFNGSIDIEGWHDPVYRDKLEMTGQVHALNYLKNCRGGCFVVNPQ